MCLVTEAISSWLPGLVGEDRSSIGLHPESSHGAVEHVFRPATVKCPPLSKQLSGLTFRERLRHLVTPGGIYPPVYIKDGSYNRKQLGA